LKKAYTLKPLYGKILLIGGVLTACGIYFTAQFFSRSSGGSVLMLVFGPFLIMIGMHYLNRLRFQQNLELIIEDEHLRIKDQWVPDPKMDDRKIKVPIVKISHLWVEENTTSSLILVPTSVENLMVSFLEDPLIAYTFCQTKSESYQGIPQAEVLAFCAEVQKKNPKILIGSPENYQTK
jgi:hypothetical protein